MFEVHEEAFERMAKAAWDRHANVPWDEFMARRPECREFYIEQMRVGLRALVEDGGYADQT